DMEDIDILKYIENMEADTYGPMPVEDDSESLNLLTVDDIEDIEDIFDTVYGPPPVDDDLDEDDIKEKH
ncbi:MAG: hypothetical protein LUC88_05805, partial [Prevotella sp.]|nr:hypothetical protein [Prevotella sp.]